MFVIRPETADWNSGAIVEAFLETVHGFELRTAICRELIAASLEMARVALIKGQGKARSFHLCRPGRWRIGNLHYFYLAAVDDDHFCQLLKDLRRITAFVVCPIGHEVVVRHALRRQRRKWNVHIMDLNSFLSWRTMFASVDANWGCSQTLFELFSRYNDRLANAGIPLEYAIGFPAPGLPFQEFDKEFRT